MINECIGCHSHSLTAPHCGSSAKLRHSSTCTIYTSHVSFFFFFFFFFFARQIFSETEPHEIGEDGYHRYRSQVRQKMFDCTQMTDTNVQSNQRLRLEIQESVPFSSWHRAPINSIHAGAILELKCRRLSCDVI